MPEHLVTDAFLDFIEKYKSYENLPEEVIIQTKRMLFDAIGNTLGGNASDKGTVGKEMAQKLSGGVEASVYGTKLKVSASAAAFANGELQNGLDYDPVPHVPPVVMPAVLAVAESVHASGKELIAATSVGCEIASRLSSVLMRAMRTDMSGGRYSVKDDENATKPLNHVMSMENRRAMGGEGRRPQMMDRAPSEMRRRPDPQSQIYGNSNEHIIGAAVACGILLKLDREKMAQCIGISAALCSLPIARDWGSCKPKSMIKYFPASWLAHTAVCAAQLAESGYTANPYTLDTPYGFPATYCRIPGIWNPQMVVAGIGITWQWLRVGIKPYPCCRYLHSNLDNIYKILSEHELSPDDIDEIRCYSAKFLDTEGQMNVETQVDAQFSIPYTLALVAFGYKPGPEWQSKEAMTDPKIKAFMPKIKMFTSEKHYEYRKEDSKTWYAKMEIDAKGETYTAETLYSKGTNVDGYRIEQEELDSRFYNNAKIVISDEKISSAISILKKLEEYDDLTSLYDNLRA